MTHTSAPGGGPLSRRRLALYGLPAVPLAMLVGPVYAFLPNYLTQTVGLSAAGVGYALAFTRVWDVISDPVGGILSDRFASRAIWMLAGLPLSLLGVFFLFVKADVLTITGLALASIALYTGWTLTKLNHDAWGAELTSDYDGRTRYASAREGAGLLGFLLVVILIGGAQSQGQEALSAAFRWLGWGLIAVLPVTFALAIWRIGPGLRQRSAAKLADLADLLKDRLLRRLGGAFLLNGIAAALPATLFIDFVGERLERPEWAGPLLIVYFLCGIAAIPLWSTLSTRLGKARAWTLSMAWATVFFLIVPILGPGDEIYFAIICVLTGMSLGADLALPAAIQADIVDVRQAQTQRQQTGLLFALLGMLTKLAYAVGVLAYPVLAWFGFRDGPDGDVTPESLTALALIYALVPCAAKLGAIWLMWNFPMGRKELDEAQSALET